MGMNVNLTPALEELVREKVRSGVFASASEVVCEALQQMVDRGNLHATNLALLRRELQDGLDSGAPLAWDPNDTKRVGRAKLAMKTPWKVVS